MGLAPPPRWRDACAVGVGWVNKTFIHTRWVQPLAHRTGDWNMPFLAILNPLETFTRLRSSGYTPIVGRS